MEPPRGAHVKSAAAWTNSSGSAAPCFAFRASRPALEASRAGAWLSRPSRRRERPLGAALTGSPLAHSNFRRRVWLPALAAAGLEGIHFHDLRHTGNQLTANAGANPKELMVCMGHDSARAAMIYLRSSRERQRALADAVGEAARGELAKFKPHNQSKPSGTQRARNRRTGSGSGV
jgi:hypothetical protein